MVLDIKHWSWLTTRKDIQHMLRMLWLWAAWTSNLVELKQECETAGICKVSRKLLKPWFSLRITRIILTKQRDFAMFSKRGEWTQRGCVESARNANQVQLPAAVVKSWGINPIFMPRGLLSKKLLPQLDTSALFFPSSIVNLISLNSIGAQSSDTFGSTVIWHLICSRQICQLWWNLCHSTQYGSGSTECIDGWMLIVMGWGLERLRSRSRHSAPLNTNLTDVFPSL